MNRKKHTHLLKTLAGALGILLALLAYACASPGTGGETSTCPDPCTGTGA